MQTKGDGEKSVRPIPPLSPVELVEKGWVAGFGGVLAKMKHDPKATLGKQAEKPSAQHVKRE